VKKQIHSSIMTYAVFWNLINRLNCWLFIYLICRRNLLQRRRWKYCQLRCPCFHLSCFIFLVLRYDLCSSEVCW